MNVAHKEIEIFGKSIRTNYHDTVGLQAWRSIWKSDIKRAYRSDFEFYSKKGAIRIYLSVE